jgi:hypothetical protein
MYTLSYWNDLQNWKRIAQSSFGYGQHITASRFHILKKMIDWRVEFATRHLNFHGVSNDENVETMLALSRICEFAEEVTNGEQKILLHIFIGLCEEELQKEDVKGSLAWKRGNLYLSNDLEKREESDVTILAEHTDDWSDGKHFDEPYPPEDSADYLSDIPI